MGDKTKNLYKISDISADGPATEEIDCYLDRTFTISAIEENLSLSAPVWRVRFTYLDGSLKYVTDKGYAYAQFPETFKATPDNPVIKITTRNVSILSGKYKKIQIEYGSTATEYEPYGYKIPVKVEEDISNIEFKKGYFIDANNNESQSSGYKYCMDYIPVQPSTEYEFSFVGPINTSHYVTVPCYEEDKSFVSRISGLGNFEVIPKVIRFKTPENCYFIRFSMPAGSYEIEFKRVTNIYLNEPLRKINDYVDYLDFENKKVVRNIYHEFITTIAGTSSLAGTYKIFLCLMEKTPYFRSQVGFAISNKFIHYERGYTNLPSNGGYIQSYITSDKLNRIAFTFNDTSINTIELAQEKIGDGFDVCYVLAEPIEEDITLPNIPLNKGTNIIEVDTNILPSNMEVKYYGKE